MLSKFQICCQNFSLWYVMTHSNVFLTHLNMRIFLLSLQTCCLNFRYLLKISDMWHDTMDWNVGAALWRIYMCHDLFICDLTHSYMQWLVNVWHNPFIRALTHAYVTQLIHKGWLWLVGSIKLYVSFAKEPYKRDEILQKRPVILSILLSVATPYVATRHIHMWYDMTSSYVTWPIHVDTLICDTTHSYVQFDSCIRDVTYSYVVTWHIHMW